MNSPPSAGARRRGAHAAPFAALDYPGVTLDSEEAGTAQRYAERLIVELCIQPQRTIRAPWRHPAVAWAQSGLMALTGEADETPQLCPLALASCADGALAALESLAPEGSLTGIEGRLTGVEGSALLAERAAITHHARAGGVSAGGGCHLLDVADGVIALNLPRAQDWELLPAWLEEPGLVEAHPNWDCLQDKVRSRTADELVAGARTLGLAAAVAWYGALADDAAPRAPPPPPPLQLSRASCPVAVPCSGLRAPRVLDLSSLWAGPLCADLLRRLGADVVKVESLHRPDGARSGPAAFFGVLNAHKRSVALDFRSMEGRARLHALVMRADIVIEASRPRALRQLGIEAEAIVLERPSLSWISLTGHGREEPGAQWIAYGDDAGVAGGLSARMAQVSGKRLIVGDAIADPLTGLHAALAGWAGYLRATVTGVGAGLVSVPLTSVVGRCAAFETPGTVSGLRRRWHSWRRWLRDTRCEPAAPRARIQTSDIPLSGADNVAVFADWGEPA
jgi:crotonobetainyl-CoA:carnitine CoA-transferase CaiB-like acyl-CoA transferase